MQCPGRSVLEFSTKLLSHSVGAFADIPVPRPFRRFVIGTFSRCIRADHAEARGEFEEFRSCGEYFVRALRPGSRPIANSPLVSPVDGTLRAVYSADASIPQIKGSEYSVSELLDGDAHPYQKGSAAVLYLAPHNYHRVHAPFAGTISRVKLIKGALWPVNDWGLRNVPKLFCRNERIVIEGEGALGPWALVMVGATNVGRMELTFSKVGGAGGPESEAFPSRFPVASGAELGRFRLGSTVVLVTSFPVAAIERPRAVRYGEALQF
jgi:phosphatidylserine decarboxylase